MTFIQNRSTLTSGEMTTHTMNLHMSILLHKKRINSNAVRKKDRTKEKRQTLRIKEVGHRDVTSRLNATKVKIKHP